MSPAEAQRVLKASHARRNAAKEQKAVDVWNAAHPEGTLVYVVKDLGEVVETETRSPAWLAGGHTALVSVNGIIGGYMLARVRAR